MIKLTAKQEKFIQNIVSGMSHREAYKNVYNATNMKDETIDRKANELMKNGKITARYQELIKEFKDKALYTREEAVNDLLWIKDKSKKEIEESGIDKVNAPTFLNSVKQLTDLNGLQPDKNVNVSLGETKKLDSILNQIKLKNEDEWRIISSIKKISWFFGA